MEAFSSIIGAVGKGLGTGAGGIGAIAPLFGMINQFSQAQKEKALMDRQIYYSKHPEAIANLAKSFERPLDKSLTSGVENVVNASLGEQGLSQAPGIQSQVLSQALAPYQQQNQQMAIQEAFKAIGLPAEALGALQSTMRPDMLALMLKGILPGSQTGSKGTPGFQIPNTDPSGGGWGVPPSDTGVTFPSIGDSGVAQG
jgi:hypothetical protein